MTVTDYYSRYLATADKLWAACRERDEAYEERAVLVGKLAHAEALIASQRQEIRDMNKRLTQHETQHGSV